MSLRPTERLIGQQRVRIAKAQREYVSYLDDYHSGPATLKNVALATKRVERLLEEWQKLHALLSQRK